MRFDTGAYAFSMRLPTSIACVALTLLTLPSSARAEHLSGTLPQPPEGYIQCSYASAEVTRWTPAEGPMASFVADAYLTSADLFMGLGYDERGFWSAEADSGSDACDDCGTLRLVHTSFAGAREAFVVDRGADGEPDITPAQRRTNIKQKIFALAKGPLAVEKLHHDYELSTPKHDAEGTIERFTGWFAQVKKRDGALLRFGIVNVSFMCWCHPHWAGYTLAAPKKRP